MSIGRLKELRAQGRRAKTAGLFSGAEGGEGGAFTVRLDVDSTEFKASTQKAEVRLKELDASAFKTQRRIAVTEAQIKAVEARAAGTTLGRLGHKGVSTGGIGMRTSGVAFGAGIKIGKGGFIIEKDEFLSKSRGVLAGVAISHAGGAVLGGIVSARDFLEEHKDKSAGEQALLLGRAVGESGTHGLLDISGAKKIGTSLNALFTGDSEAEAEGRVQRMLDNYFKTQEQKNAEAAAAQANAENAMLSYVKTSVAFYGKMAAKGPKDFGLSGAEGVALWKSDMKMLQEQSKWKAQAILEGSLIKQGRADLIGINSRGAGGN